MSSTLHPISFLGVYHDNGDCHIFAHERKTAPNDFSREHFAWIVQSLTKLNDKI